jgi:hypothetical protein
VFRKLVDSAARPDNLGVWLDGIAREDVRRGDLLVTPGRGTLVQRCTARGFSWAPGPVALDARVQIVGFTDRRPVRALWSDPSPIQPGPFRCELDLGEPIPFVPARALYLRDEARLLEVSQ